MYMLPGESVLLASPVNTLTISTHRVRYHAKSFGSDDIVSIMLEELVSCGLVRNTKQWLLVTAAICAVGTFLAPGSARALLLVCAIVFAASYFATRRHVLAISSAGHTITVSIAGMSTDDIMRFIETAEHAKNERYLLHAVPTGSARGYSPTR